MATRSLYLIRHGQYYYLEEGVQGGVVALAHPDLRDGGLTPIGVDQARLTAQRFVTYPITAIHCSSLPRAKETAEIIGHAFPNLTMKSSDLLWEGVPCIPPPFAEYFKGVPEDEITGDRVRAEEAFNTYFKKARIKDRYEIVVCHGNLIRYFICRVLNIPIETWGYMYAHNCGISEVVVLSDGSMRLVSFNDVGHLKHELIT